MASNMSRTAARFSSPSGNVSRFQEVGAAIAARGYVGPQPRAAGTVTVLGVKFPTVATNAPRCGGGQVSSTAITSADHGQ